MHSSQSFNFFEKDLTVMDTDKYGYKFGCVTYFIGKSKKAFHVWIFALRGNSHFKKAYLLRN